MLRDLTGQKFGELTVIKIHHKDKLRKVYWECECSCGNTVVKRSDHITRVKRPNCGCITKELLEENSARALDLIGERFGRLIVIEKTNKIRIAKRLEES